MFIWVASGCIYNVFMCKHSGTKINLIHILSEFHRMIWFFECLHNWMAENLCFESGLEETLSFCCGNMCIFFGYIFDSICLWVLLSLCICISWIQRIFFCLPLIHSLCSNIHSVSFKVFDTLISRGSYS